VLDTLHDSVSSLIDLFSPFPAERTLENEVKEHIGLLGPNDCTLFIENTCRWWKRGRPCTALWSPLIGSWAQRAQAELGDGLPMTHWPSQRIRTDNNRPKSLVPVENED
jgi:hypothetical protein